MKKEWFFGWSNIRTLIKELLKMYSNADSYFSKKRVESGIAFVVGQGGMIYFLIKNIDKLVTSDIVLWTDKLY